MLGDWPRYSRKQAGELVISADGRKHLFLAVLALIRASPTVGRWDFNPFRGRSSFREQSDGERAHVDLIYEGKKYPSSLIRYALTRDERKDKIGVMLFMKGYSEEEEMTFKSFAYLYLDSILGEYDVEMHVGAVEVLPHDCEEYVMMDGGNPLHVLPRDFDSRLGNKIGTKPRGGWSSLLPADLKPNKRAPLSKVSTNK